MDEPSSFGYWVRRRRKALDLTQADLAHRVGCAEVTIQKIEADERRPSSQIAARLADQLAIAPADRAAFIRAARAELGVDRLAPPLQHVSRAPGSTVAPALLALPAAGLPGGTVTFLFTDIEGSTPLWEREPDQMRLALARHDAILRSTIAKHGGHAYKVIGDAFQAAFAFPAHAVAAALAAQHTLAAQPWETSDPLRVRMGLHVGPAVPEGNDYSATHTLNRVARIMSSGHGGQILLSVEVADLVRRDLPMDVTLRDLGKQRMKGLMHLEHLFQVTAPDLPATFPPLNTLDLLRTNLPVQLTSFIGREKAITDVKQLLNTSRLVTLTGPGGAGKTRLGLQVASELGDIFRDGAYFVNLAPISDPALVVATIAQTLGVKERGSWPLIESLKAALHDKDMLLLLDNFEQVLEAAPQLAELLAGCPKLKLLITSREVLHLYGEHEFGVPPLALPPPAVLLTGGGRDLAARHQTIRGAIDWSYHLLDAAEQMLFARLGVFAGGFTLAAAETVCAGEGLEADDVLDVLSHLVDKSLIAVTQDGATRYRLLETIRQYSQEQLERAGETGPFYLRHAQWCLKLVAGAEQGLRGAQQAAWFEQLESEHDNLRAGLSRASDPAMQLQLASALFFFWSRRGYLSEGRRWLAMALGNAQSLEPSSTHAKALYSAAQLAYLQGDPAAARSLAVQSIAVSRQVGDNQSYAYALTFLGLAAANQGDIETARSVGTESVALFRQVGDAWGLAMALHCLGITTREAGDPNLAWPLIEESLALFRMTGDQWGMALVLLNVGGLEFLQQNYGAAQAAFEASLTIFQQFGDTWGVNAALNSLGQVALKQRDYMTARSYLQTVLSSRWDLGDKQEIPEAFAGLAAVASAQGQLRRAAALGGAAEALFESIGSRIRSLARANFSPIVADLPKAIGEHQFATIWAEGRAMTIDQAIEYAFALPTMTESTAVQDDDRDVLQQTVQSQLGG